MILRTTAHQVQKATGACKMIIQEYEMGETVEYMGRIWEVAQYVEEQRLVELVDWDNQTTEWAPAEQVAACDFGY
jgi:hypothetical protein